MLWMSKRRNASSAGKWQEYLPHLENSQMPRYVISDSHEWFHEILTILSNIQNITTKETSKATMKCHYFHRFSAYSMERRAGRQSLASGIQPAVDVEWRPLRCGIRRALNCLSQTWLWVGFKTIRTEKLSQATIKQGVCSTGPCVAFIVHLFQ